MNCMLMGITVPSRRRTQSKSPHFFFFYHKFFLWTACFAFFFFICRWCSTLWLLFSFPSNVPCLRDKPYHPRKTTVIHSFGNEKAAAARPSTSVPSPSYYSSLCGGGGGGGSCRMAVSSLSTSHNRIRIDIPLRFDDTTATFFSVLTNHCLEPSSSPIPPSGSQCQYSCLHIPLVEVFHR